VNDKNKIIMYYNTSYQDAVNSYRAVEFAINDNIEKGRHNFISYMFPDNKCVSVCKNGDSSFTTYTQTE
jgi:hypothetical protein